MTYDIQLKLEPVNGSAELADALSDLRYVSVEFDSPRPGEAGGTDLVLQILTSTGEAALLVKVIHSIELCVRDWIKTRPGAIRERTIWRLSKRTTDETVLRALEALADSTDPDKSHGPTASKKDNLPGSKKK